MIGAILGVASIAGSAIQSAINYRQQQKAYDYQRWLNEERMKREDNAYQRAVADMKNAGLSPLGAVASSAGEMSAGPAPQYDDKVTQSIANSLQGMQLQEQSRVNDSTIALNNSQAAKNYADYSGKLTENVYKSSQILTQLEKTRAEIAGQLEQNKITSAEADKRKVLLDKRIDDLQANIDKMNKQLEIMTETQLYNKILGVPTGTSWSSSGTSPIGYGQTTGKILAEQNAIDSSNKQTRYNAEKIAEQNYKDELKLRERRLSELKVLSDKTKGVSDRNNYYLAKKSLEQFKKSKKDWIKARVDSIMSKNYE